jgi:hypothetical protein
MELKLRIINAGYKAVEELIKVEEEQILKPTDDGSDLASDRLKNAAAAKRLAIEDAFTILNRIEQEKSMLDGESQAAKEPSIRGFAEGRSK